MPSSRTTTSRWPFIGTAAVIAMAFAAAGALVVAAAGQGMIGQVVAILAGFLLLGVGAAVALAVGVPSTLWRVRANDDWCYW
jgi:hypothetical protein